MFGFKSHNDLEKKVANLEELVKKLTKDVITVSLVVAKLDAASQKAPRTRKKKVTSETK